ncbi:MAG: MFS transporter [Bdellovibrio sp.]|nr:MFS transporter [Bdellovibrio sp.]
MSNMKTFLKAGHPPTLFSAFLYFDFCFAIWVLNGAMAPFISEQFHLTPAQKGFMISVPILAGAIMRFPLGVLAQYIGRKNAALVEMGMILLAMVYGFLMVPTYNNVLAMGVLLGIAGASFGVALSLGSGWFPPKYKGLAMGISGAGNSGTVLAVLLAPPLATKYGWQAVYGFGAVFMLVPILVMIFFAKEPPDIEHQSLKDHLKCLWEKDGWVFNLVYIITFGGFIGLSNFLPTYFYDQFGVTKIEAGQLTMLAALMGSGIRILGGYVSDRFGGITTLTAIFGVVIVGVVLTGMQSSVYFATGLFMLCFAALGAGNGALFQLVPLRWPTTTAVAGSMIGEIGALGGGFIPNAMGQSKQITGSYFGGFVAFAALACVAFVVLRVAQKKWTQSWVDKGGKVRAKADTQDIQIELPSAHDTATFPEIKKSIILPVGNSELAEKAARAAVEMSTALGAKVVLVYVESEWQNSQAMATNSLEWDKVRAGLVSEGQTILNKEKERLKALKVKYVETEIRHGEFGQEVANCASQRNALMVILASQNASPIGSLLMGNRTYNLFKAATVPVLRIVR